MFHSQTSSRSPSKRSDNSRSKNANPRVDAISGLRIEVAEETGPEEYLIAIATLATLPDTVLQAIIYQKHQEKPQ